MIIVQIFEISRSVASIPRSEIIEAIKDVLQVEITKVTEEEIISVVFYDHLHGQRSVNKIKIPIVITYSYNLTIDEASKEEIAKDIEDIIKKKVYVIKHSQKINDVVERVEFAWIQSQP
jgi:predicted transcriptional regulator